MKGEKEGRRKVKNKELKNESQSKFKENSFAHWLCVEVLLLSLEISQSWMLQLLLLLSLEISQSWIFLGLSLRMHPGLDFFVAVWILQYISPFELLIFERNSFPRHFFESFSMSQLSSFGPGWLWVICLLYNVLSITQCFSDLCELQVRQTQTSTLFQSFR